MSKVKLRLITVLAFFALLVFALGIVFCLPSAAKADAATYTPSAVFSAGTGGQVGASDAEEGETSYVRFSLSDGGKVHFRRHLALRWYEAAPSSEEEDNATEGSEADSPANPAAQKYLSMTFSFPEIAFNTYEIAFESGEENISKEGKAINTVVFFYEDGALKAAVKDAKNQDTDNAELEKTELALTALTDDIVLTIDEENVSIGEFNVYLNGTKIGTFTNIGGYYLEYRSSSSTTPNTPVTFTAALSEGSETQTVLMKELNGQTFEVEDGNVTDNADPVLVLSGSVYAFRLGQSFSLTYQAMDVCDDSVSVTRSYYMLKENEEGGYDLPTDDDYGTLTTSTVFVPATDTGAEEQYVSIRFKLDDGTNTPVYAYLTWYAADGVTVTKGEGADAFDYIPVNRDQEGPKYLGISYTEENGEYVNTVTDEATAAAEAYQEALDEIAAGLSAGSGAYIYLPSLRALLGSDCADYRDLKFSIYYYKESASEGNSASSSTSLNYNALKLEISEMGLYRFRVLATYTKGTSTYSVQLVQDGELVDVTSSNIWDIDEIPEFTFEVDYDGATVEDPGEQSEGYRDSTYTFSSFDIVALSGYETEYALFRFDTDNLPEGESAPTYSEFVENIDKYMEDEAYDDCRITISEYNSDITEDDEKWDRTDNDYYWNPSSSLSFVPQVTGIYVLRAIVTDAQIPGYTVSAYEAVSVRNPIDTIPGESQWLQNNVLSVVLFSISAILLVVIVVLVIVKPSEKNVEAVNLEKLKGKKKKNHK